MALLIQALLALIALVGGYYVIFTPSGHSKLQNFLANYITGAIAAAAPLVSSLSGSVRTVVDAFIAAFRGPGAGIIADLTAPMGDVAEAAFTAVSAHLTGAGTVTPDKWKANAVDAMRDAGAFTLAALGTAAAMESLFPEKLQSLAGIAEVLETVAGLDEVTRSWLGPLLAASIGRPATYDANARTRSVQLGAGQAAGLHARGIISESAARAAGAYAGQPDANITAILTGAYGGIAPRQLLRLINTGLFSDADIRDELDFAGIRPTSQSRWLLAAPYLASATERTQLRAELEAAYGQGLLDAVELADRLDSAEHDTDRNDLVLQRVSLQTQVTLTKALESEFTTGYVAGVTTQPIFESQVRGLPIQPWKADAIIGLAEARRNATLFRQDAAAARALERATAAAERRTAMKSYASGYTDVAALTAALILTGLTATEAAAWVALAALQKSGNVRWVYGMQLTPEAATILKQRVAALTDQRKHGLLTDTQYGDQLLALRLPDNWINALRAAANATLTPAKSRTFTPVATS